MQKPLDGYDTCRGSDAGIAATAAAVAVGPAVVVAVVIDTAVTAHAAAVAVDIAAVIADAPVGSVVEVAVASVYHWMAAAMKNGESVKAPVVRQCYCRASPIRA